MHRAGQGWSSAGTLIHQAEKSPDLAGVGQDVKLTHMDCLLHGERTGDRVLENSSTDAMPVETCDVSSKPSLTFVPLAS